MKPDVIVTCADQTATFKTQNKRVCDWLCQRYHMTSESANGHTEIRVHPGLIKRIVEELKAAGFNVSTL
jgi:hypothetical protein